MPEPTLTYARAGHTNGWHGPQAGSKLRLGWQAWSTAGSGQPGDLGGAAVVNFWAGKLCFLSLNVAFFFVLFLVVSCAVCCAHFCDQIIREVVLLIFSTFQKHGREHKKKTQHQARVFP